MNTCPRCQSVMDEGATVCSVCNYDTTEAPATDDAITSVRAAREPPYNSPYEPRTGSGGTTENEDLTAAARASLQGRWGMAILGFLLYVVIVNAIQIVPYLGTIAMVVLGGPFTLGIAIFAMSIARDKELNVSQIFDGFKQFGVSLAAYWIITIFVFLWALLLIIPGIIAAYAYSMAFYIIADDPSINAMEAIGKSKAMMQGYKMKLFLLHLRFVIWALLCVLTLGIGLLWLFPYMGTTMVKFYDDLPSPTLNSKDPA